MARWYLLPVLLLFLVQCSGLHPKSRHETEGRTYDHRYDLVYKAAKLVLLEDGYRIVNEDRRKGLLETDWAGGDLERTRITARIADLDGHHTRVDLGIRIERKNLLGDKWHRAKVELFAYDVLFERIDIQAYREYFPRMEDKSRKKNP